MIAILTNLAPILIGFVSKLVAIRSHQEAERQKLIIAALAARSDAISRAREDERKESPMAAMNRRIIMLTILSLVVAYVLAPLFVDVQTVIPFVEQGFSLLGIQFTSDKVVYNTVEGLVKYDEVFKWATLIVEFYFGAQIAKNT